VIFVAGGALWLLTRSRDAAAAPATPGALPPTRPRFGLAMAALGLATLASTQQGLGWSISAICFSLIAIILLVTLLMESLRR